MHYSVLTLQPSASPFDHQVPLSPLSSCPYFFFSFFFIFQQNQPFLMLVLLSPHLPAPPGLIFPLWLTLSIIFTTCFQFLRYLQLATYTNLFILPAVYLGMLHAAWVLSEEGQDIWFWVFICIPCWFWRGVIGMILPKLLRFGVGTHQASVRLRLLHASAQWVYTTDPATRDAPSPQNLLLLRNCEGLGTLQSNRIFPCFNHWK